MKTRYLRQGLLLVALGGALTAANAEPAGASVSVGVSGGLMSISGDDEIDRVELRRSDVDPSMLTFDVDGNHVPDGSVVLNSVKSISADLGGGNDSFKVTEDNGPITDTRPTTVIGGNGEDLLLGGSGTETLIGGNDNDSINGGKGNDALFGGLDNDFIRWDAGDGADLVDGGPGDDLQSANGTSGPESFRILREDLRLFLTRSDELALDMIGVDRLHVSAMGGNDRITAFPGTGELAHLTLNGGILAGPDDDEIIGSDSADTIRGDAGSDKLDGRGGDDTITGGSGDDSVIGGTGHDGLTGGVGTDSFECDAIGEALDLEPGEPFQGECVAPEPPAGGGETTPPPTTPAGDPLGFAKPRVKATKAGLRVTLKSTSAAPVSISLKVKERFKSRRGARYRIVRKTIAAGGRITLRLRAPRALRNRIARQLALRGRVVRRPTVAVTNTATTGHTAVHPRLTLRVH